ncbi:hypothetical protein ACHAWF_006116 [Thalassiosira exigua]
MATSASPSPSCTYVLGTVWAAIEPFLELQGTISASCVCRELRRAAVDPDAGAVKVSHFTAWEHMYSAANYEPLRRIPYYLPFALNAIHFPYLRQLSLGFTGIELPDAAPWADIDNSAAFCFPVLATQLARARNLESLELSLGSTLDANNNRFEPLIRLFGRNLAQCKKLEVLKLIGHEEYCSCLMKELILSITPVVTKQRYVLHHLTIIFSGGPDMNSTPDSLESLQYAAVDFFANILRCSDLESLYISVTNSACLGNGLLDASYQHWHSHPTVDDSFNECFRKLEDLTIYLDFESGSSLGGRNESAEMLFRMFTDCQLLEKVHLSLPRTLWDKKMGIIGNVLREKPNLWALSLCFDWHYDNNGMAIQLLEYCIGDKESNECNITNFGVQSLMKVDGKRLLNLVQNRDSRVCWYCSDWDCFVSEESFFEGNEARVSVDPGAKREDMPERVDIENIGLLK